ncbi:MAG: biotin/lipoyl-containing protein [Anaerolineae bacterium]
MLYRYQYQGETYSVRLQTQADGSLLATIGDEIYHLNATRLSDGTFLLDLDGIRHTLHTAKTGDARYVQWQGQQYALIVDSGRRRAKRGAGARGDLTAEMPGQVLDVRVAVGDVVSAGQVLAVLEAMKMEIRISAPYDGGVTRVLVQTGDIVERGQVLVEVNAAE